MNYKVFGLTSKTILINAKWPNVQTTCKLADFHLCTPLCITPSGTRPSGLFSHTQWKFCLPSTQRIFVFYPAVFILPQWLCGVTQNTPRKRTNNQKIIIIIKLKQRLLQKSKAIESSTSCSSSRTESDSSSSDSEWWQSHLKTDWRIEIVNKKQFRRGLLNATNSIKACPNFQNIPVGDCPLTSLHPQVFRPIISHYHATFLKGHLLKFVPTSLKRTTYCRLADDKENTKQ